MNKPFLCQLVIKALTFTMRDLVTTSMRPLSGTLTISLSHEVWDATASAVTDTFITPNKDQQTQHETFRHSGGSH